MRKFRRGRLDRHLDTGKKLVVGELKNTPKEGIRELLENLFKAFFTLAFSKFISILAILSGFLGVVMPIAWIIIGIAISIVFLLYNRKKIINFRSIAAEAKRIDMEVRERLGSDYSKFLAKLNPKYVYFTNKSSKEAQCDIEALYSIRKKMLGVDIEEIENMKNNEDGISDLEELRMDSLDFLHDVYQLFNRNTHIRNELNPKARKTLNALLDKIEVTEDMASLKPEATLFEDVDFEYNSDFAINAQATMFKIKQYAAGKADITFVEDAIEETEGIVLSHKDILDLAIMAVNTTLISTAVLEDLVDDQILKMKDAPVNIHELKKARQLVNILSSQYPGDRCEELCHIFYGSETLDNSEYRELFWMLNQASAKNILSNVSSREDLLAENPHRIEKVIDDFAPDIELSDALNFLRIGLEITQRK